MQATVVPATTTSELASDLYALIAFVHRHCNSDLLEAVGALDLSLTQIKLLHHLEDSPNPRTLKEAAELVHVSLPAASRLVEDLVRRGFVDRHEDADDRRMKRVELTDHGRWAIHRVNAARLSGMEDFVETLTPRERKQIAAALTELLKRPDMAECRPEEVRA